MNLSNGEENFYFKSSLEMNEHYELNGFESNKSNINLNLLSESTRIKDLYINFSDIQYQAGYVSSEENEDVVKFKTINKFTDGYAVQINISERTKIYGVNVYIQDVGSEVNKLINISIKGYDIGNNSPNNIFYVDPFPLNISNTGPGWFIQTFPSPVFLSKGNYFLVLDGSTIDTSPKYETRWFYNDIDPFDPNLYISELNSGIWQQGEEGKPFLYKLIYDNAVIMSPEEINMTARINDNIYEIQNGTQKGEGFITKTDVNIIVNTEILTILINNNFSSNLWFNYSYNLNIFGNSIEKINAVMNSNLNDTVLWTLNPSIIRKSDNMTVRFIYPSNWTNITVFKDNLNISSEIIINKQENYILITNDTIESEVDWEILAYSTKLQISLNTPKLEFETGQELRFELNNPTISGNYTFVLIDSYGLEIYRIMKTIPPDNNLFSYLIPENIDAGNFKALIYWNNNSHAGVSTREFNIIKGTNTRNLNNDLLPIILGIVIGGGSIIGVGSIFGAKKHISNKKKKLDDFFQKCSELLNIKSIIVTEKISGVALYSRSFSGKDFDGDLLSGFFQAIRNFGEEALEEFEDSRTLKLNYKNYAVLMNDFVNVRLIVIMKEQPSPNFQYTLDDLTYDIYMKYGSEIDNFKGDLSNLRDIENIIKQYLDINLIYPLKVNQKDNIKLKLNIPERRLFEKAKKMIQKRNENFFYSISILPQNECQPEDFSALKSLIEKEIFLPIKRQTEKYKEDPLILE
ncbi:MAG: hypothetical protein GF311_18090 [Candidatus Lokiarchaeota archaeon]|nr:hypothetical protein [Candidatus Lokiarchaeota archaeon]